MDMLVAPAEMGIEPRIIFLRKIDEIYVDLEANVYKYGNDI
jgi:hypothetical protein